MGPRSSMGSPVTFMIRPRVPRPTGIMMGAPVSVALDPRTRPSVPASIHQFCACRFIQRAQLTVHGNTPDDVLTQMLLRLISDITDDSTSCAYSDFQSQLVAAVVRCQGIENGGELLGVELDIYDLCSNISATLSRRMPQPGKVFYGVGKALQLR
jgi:hypothetical protein